MTTIQKPVELWTVREAARELGCKEIAIRRWISSGKMEATLLPGTSRAIYLIAEKEIARIRRARAMDMPGLEEKVPILEEEKAQQRARLFTVLSSTVRLQLLELLLRCDGTMCVAEIVVCFHREQPTISHHLKELVNAGLINYRKHDLYAYYFVCPERTEEVEGFLRGLR